MARRGQGGTNLVTADRNKFAQYQLPGDIQADLQDAFCFYDKHNEGWISMSHFKTIMHNFGFRRLSQKEKEDFTDKIDPGFLKKSGIDYETVKYVIARRWTYQGS